MKKLTKAILTFLLVVSVISSIASAPKLVGQANGGISTFGHDDWGWMVSTN